MLFTQGVFVALDGNAEKDGSLMEEMGTKTSIKVNKETKELLEAKRMDLTGIEHNRIVDLSVDGDRWEGDVLNGEPCGW